MRADLRAERGHGARLAALPVPEPAGSRPLKPSNRGDFLDVFLLVSTGANARHFSRLKPMLFVTIDPRDGGAGVSGGSSCAKCCCEPIGIRPGECNLMTLNYAPWSVPFGGRGLVPTTQISIDINRENCSSQTIDGFGPPAYTAIDITTPVNTPVVGDIEAQMLPAGNSFTYKWLSVYGPEHGALTAFNEATGAWTYTPDNGYTGYDVFWFKATDAQGRTVIRRVVIAVGAVSGANPSSQGYGLNIDRSKVAINNRMHQVSFVMCLSPAAEGSVDECARYRVTIRQPANDCDRTFYHLTCFDVYPVKC